MSTRRIATRVGALGGTAVAGAVLALAPALPAHAANCKTTHEGYSHKKVSVCGVDFHQGHPQATVSSSNGATLPFTGAEVTLMGTVGLGLIAGGTVFVVAGRRRRATSS